MFPTTPLSRGEWGACVAIGATPLGIAALLKLTPESWLGRIKVDKLVDENRTTEATGVLKAYNDASKIKVTDLKKGGLTKGEEDNDFRNV